MRLSEVNSEIIVKNFEIIFDWVVGNNPTFRDDPNKITAFTIPKLVSV